MAVNYIIQSSLFESAKQMERDSVLSEAEKCYLEAIKHEEMQSETYFALARCQFKMEKYDDAIKSYEKSITSRTIGLVNQLSKALGFSIKLDVNNESELWLWFSLSLLKDKEIGLSLACLNRSIVLSEKPHPAWYSLNAYFVSKGLGSLKLPKREVIVA